MYNGLSQVYVWKQKEDATSKERVKSSLCQIISDVLVVVMTFIEFISKITFFYQESQL